MILYVMKNDEFPAYLKLGVTKKLEVALQRVNRYVPTETYVLWVCPVTDRKVFDTVREHFGEAYLRNGYFDVPGDSTAWVREIEALLNISGTFMDSPGDAVAIHFCATEPVFSSAVTRGFTLSDTSNEVSSQTTFTNSVSSGESSTTSGGYVSRTEAARQVGVNPKTLKRWEEEGLIEVPAAPSGRPAYTQSVMDRLFQRVQRKPSPSENDDKDYL